MLGGEGLEPPDLMAVPKDPPACHTLERMISPNCLSAYASTGGPGVLALYQLS